jgi:hypothetical protein
MKNSGGTLKMIVQNDVKSVLDEKLEYRLKELERKHKYERNLLNLLIEDIRANGLQDTSPLMSLIDLGAALDEPIKVSDIHKSISWNKRLEKLESYGLSNSILDTKDAIDEILYNQEPRD